MGQFVSLLVLTVVVGSVYSLAAAGLVLTYKTSRVFNFAHGAVGMFFAYVFRQLWVEWGVPLPLAILLVVGVGAPLTGVAFERVLFRPLRTSSTAVKVVATVGLLIALQGLAAAIWGQAGLFVPPLVGTRSFSIAGTAAIGSDQLLVAVIAGGVTGGLALLLNRTRFGLEIRAVVNRPELAELSGIRSGRTSQRAWALGFATAALAGVLLSPLIGLDTYTLTLLVIQAYAAALIGRLASLGLTFLGGLAIAFAEQAATLYLPGGCELCRIARPTIPFLAIFGLLVFAAYRPRSRLGSWLSRAAVDEAAAPPPKPRATERSSLLLRFAPALLVGVAVVAPVLGDRWILRLTGAVVMTGVFLSLTVITGYSGQISLGHTAFVGTGAFVMGALTTRVGLPFPVALLAAGLAAVPVALVVALPALRLHGLFLALLTFGYGLVATSIFGSSLTNAASGLEVSRPSFASSDLGYLYLALVVTTLIGLGTWSLGRSASGRMLSAIRSSERGVRAIGVDPAPYKQAAFTLSAFMAGLAGALLGGFQSVVTFNDFNIFFSLVWLAVAVIGGIGSVAGAVMAGVVWLFGQSASGTTGQIAFGVGAILLAHSGRGIAGVLPQVRDLVRRVEWFPRAAVEGYTAEPVPEEAL